MGAVGRPIEGCLDAMRITRKTMLWSGIKKFVGQQPNKCRWPSWKLVDGMAVEDNRQP